MFGNLVRFWEIGKAVNVLIHFADIETHTSPYKNVYARTHMARDTHLHLQENTMIHTYKICVFFAEFVGRNSQVL